MVRKVKVSYKASSHQLIPFSLLIVYFGTVRTHLQLILNSRVFRFFALHCQNAIPNLEGIIHYPSMIRNDIAKGPDSYVGMLWVEKHVEVKIQLTKTLYFLDITISGFDAIDY